MGRVTAVTTDAMGRVTAMTSGSNGPGHGQDRVTVAVIAAVPLQ